MGLPVWGVTHSCVMRCRPDEEKLKPGSLNLNLLLPQLSAFLESLVPTNALVRKAASVGFLVRWPDKCHMLPGKLSLSPLSNRHRVLAPAGEKAFDFIQSFGGTLVCQRSCGRSLRYLLHVQTAAGENYTLLQTPGGLAAARWTPAFGHYRCYTLNKHRWLEEGKVPASVCEVQLMTVIVSFAPALPLQGRWHLNSCSRAPGSKVRSLFPFWHLSPVTMTTSCDPDVCVCLSLARVLLKWNKKMNAGSYICWWAWRKFWHQFPQKWTKTTIPKIPA